MHKSTALVAAVALLALVMIAIMVNQQSVAQTPGTPRFAPKWEYKTIRHDLTTETRGDTKSELNALGEEAWELCATVRTEGLPFLILKRPASSGRRDR